MSSMTKNKVIIQVGHCRQLPLAVIGQIY